MLEVLVESLVDSLKVFIFIFIVNVIIGLFENKLSLSLSKTKKNSPIIGASVALIPQCGVSVLGTDLYIDGHISLGTLIAVYIATSDEALPMLLSSKEGTISLIFLVLIKFVVASIIGILVDALYKKGINKVNEHLSHDCHHEESHIGCCNHDIENDSKINRLLIHPLLHSLKILLYVFIINLIFGSMFYFIGESNVISFLTKNELLAPIFSAIVGLIPNCASSVILTDLYLIGGLNFGSLVAGLTVNSGLGIMILLKNKEHQKDLLIILPVLILVALVLGYIITILF